MNQTLASAFRFGLLAVAAVAVTAFVLLTRGGDTAPAVALDTVADDAPAAAAPQSGPSGFPDGGSVAGGGPTQPDFTISRDEDCSTSGPSGLILLVAGGPPDKKCLVAPGASFTVDVTLEDLGGIILGDTGGYSAIAIRLDYSWNLTVKKPPVAAPGSPCDDSPKAPSFMEWAIAEEGIGKPVNQFWIVCLPDFTSDYTGPLVSVEFNCPTFKTKEVVTLANAAPVLESEGLPYESWGTGLFDDLFEIFIPENNRNESLVINCDNYYPWDVHGGGQSADLDGIVDLPNDILGVIQHFCPLVSMPCSKANLP